MGDELERLMLVLGTAIVTAFLAALRRHVEIKHLDRLPCRCPHCGHQHTRKPPKMPEPTPPGEVKPWKGTPTEPKSQSE